MENKEQKTILIKYLHYQIYNKIKDINASKILYVDDSSVSLLVAKYILDELGYQNRCVSNLNAIMLEIEDFQPDIFLLDIIMTKCNGIELVKQIKEEYKKKSIYIATSVLDNSFDLNEISQNFDYFIPKPIEKANFNFLTIGDKIAETIKEEKKPSYFKTKIRNISKHSIIYRDPYPKNKGRLVLQGNPYYQSFLQNISRK